MTTTPAPLEQVNWIDSQAPRMERLLKRWVNINSGSANLPGLERMAKELEKAFGKLGDVRRLNVPPRTVLDANAQTIQQPHGQALSLIKRPRAKRRVLLVIHMDTVFSPDNAFQRWEQLDKDTLRGPGTADAKGGLLVMLLALEAFERSGQTNNLGWHVIINPDEEVGSWGSREMLAKAARRCEVGLVFEPCLPDGAIVAQRKGSGYFTFVVRGRAAHAGRDFQHGRNAIAAAAHLADRLHQLSDLKRGITVNVGRIDGGGPLNQVPDLGIVRINVRYPAREHESEMENHFHQLIADINAREGYQATLHGEFNAPPKPLDDPTAEMIEHLQSFGQQLGLDIDTKSTGGVCDGNRLAAAGLPTIDTLGPQGDNLHSDREYILLPSLTQRAKLTAMLLLQLASGKLNASIH